MSPAVVGARRDLPEQHVVGPHVAHLLRRDRAGAVGAAGACGGLSCQGRGRGWHMQGGCYDRLLLIEVIA